MRIPNTSEYAIEFTKSSPKTPHAELFGVFEYSDELDFTLTVPRRIGVHDPVIVFWRDDDRYEFSIPFEWCGDDFIHETYKLHVAMADLCPNGAQDALLWYTVVFHCAFGWKRLSVTDGSYRPKVDYADAPYRAWQLTVDRDGTREHSPTSFKGSIMYHIFVDRFNKGSVPVPVREDAIINDDWYNGIPQYAKVRGGFVENNMFFGGTLYGIIEKLDYLKELGVDVIYLSPIFEAYSNHKYDTGNYMKIDDMFGGEDAFDKLIAAAKERNIRIILDGVFNHTGDDSIYFNKKGRYDSIGAYQSPDSPYYNWYDFESYPDKYRCWWGIEILPAVTTTNPEYTEYITGQGGVIEHYINKGISGWRLDVADELNMSFIEKLRVAAKRANPQAIIYGEVWEDASDKVAYGTRRKYFRGYQLDSVMNYPLKDGIINFVKYGNKQALFEASAGLYSHYPKTTSDTLMNLLGTHDTKRILTALGIKQECDRSPDALCKKRLSKEARRDALRMLRLCYALCATLPGIPCIYYGDEAGMEGYSDPFNRMPYPWGHEDVELRDFYTKIGKIRHSNSLFTNGYFRVDESTPKDLFAFWRFDDNGNSVYIAVNAGNEKIPFAKEGIDLISGKIYDGDDFIPAKSAVILDKLPNSSYRVHK